MSDVIRIVNESEYNAPAPALPPEVAPPLPAAKLPGAKLPGVSIRPGVLSDYPFIDALQKANKHGVGFMWEKAIKGHIEKGNVLIAEAIKGVGSSGLGVGGRHAGDGVGGRGERERDEDANGCDASAPTPNPQNPTPPPASPVGYVLGVDRYLKRDELGVIYQMCVVPEYRRSLVAANLLKAKFESSAYGCRLYCCWCAQDLAANRFWEAMGFVPLAFRTGGRGRGAKGSRGPGAARMHIFWQKRIREGDTGNPAEGGTPYWFPGVTGAGAIGEDRIVLPIPPGTHWSDAKPVVLPEGPLNQGGEIKLLEDEVSRLERERRKGSRCEGRGARGKRGARGEERGSRGKAGARRANVGGLHFGAVPEPPAPGVIKGEDAANADAKRAAEDAAAVEQELKEAKRALRREKKKFDPAQVAFARELKDRWLEQVQAQPALLAPGAEKYAVRRRIEATAKREPEAVVVKRLDAA